MSKLKKALVVFLGINTLMQIGMGIMMLQDFQQVATSMLNLNYSEDMSQLGGTLGMNVLFLGMVLILSMYWIYQKNRSGVSLAIFIGLFVAIAGVFSYSQGVQEGLTMDVPRGMIILVLGYLIQRQDNSSSSLNKAPKV